MSKPNGFIKLHRVLWQSDEWRALSPNAQVVLIDIWARFNGRNNGEINYGYREAQHRLHCCTATAKRTFRELKTAGFIQMTASGSFDHKHGARKGTASKWRLTFL